MRQKQFFRWNLFASATFSSRARKGYRSRAKRKKKFFRQNSLNFEVRGREFSTKKPPRFLPGGSEYPLNLFSIESLEKLAAFHPYLDNRITWQQITSTTCAARCYQRILEPIRFHFQGRANLSELFSFCFRFLMRICVFMWAFWVAKEPLAS